MSSGLAQYGGEAPVEQDITRKHVVQEATYLPDSIIWKLLANYYKKMACEAWTDNYVPMFVTSNSRFVKHYALMFLQFMKDWYQLHRGNGPIYIVEIGGGHGRFSFLFLRHLLRLKPLWEKQLNQARPFVFVFSDVADSNVNYVRKHPAMQQFIDEGWLDFALFDANVDGREEGIHLQIAGREIPRELPIAVVANYVLDSLLTDGFQVRRKNGRIHYYRAKLAVYSPQAEANAEDPDIIARMTLGWDWEEFEFPKSVTASLKDDESPLACINAYNQEDEYMACLLDKHRLRLQDCQEPREPAAAAVSCDAAADLPAAPHYLAESPMLQAVVQSYARGLEDIPGFDVASLVLPIGAMQLVTWLRRYSGDRLMLMIGDKGYADATEFRGNRPPHIAIHGSISFMVNLDAIKKFVRANGGFSVASPFKDTFQCTFSFCVAHRGGQLQHASPGLADNNRHDHSQMLDPADLPSCAEWATLNMCAMVPDVLIAWQRQCQDDIAAGHQIPLKALISLIRYSEHDPDVFLNIKKELIAACVTPLCGARLESDIQGDLQLIASHWYKLRATEDVADALAQLAMKTGRLSAAAKLFHRSLEEVPEGRHAATYVNLAACYKSLGQFAEAKLAVDEALAMHPDYPPALTLQGQILLCLNPVSVCLVGRSNWITRTIAPALARDQRVRVKAVFAFSQQDAEELGKDVRMGASCRVVWGSLDKILQAEDLDGLIMDLPAGLMTKTIEKISKSSKALLVQSPLGLNGREAQDAVLNWAKINRCVFHAVAASRADETLVETGRRARSELGGINCVLATRTVPPSEFNADQCTWIAQATAELVGAAGTIVAGEAVGVAAVEGSDGASGWLDFLCREPERKRVKCSFAILKGDPSLSLKIICEKTTVHATLNSNHSWRVEETCGKTSGAMADGLTNCLDSWITAMRREPPSTISASPTMESMPPGDTEAYVVHRSLREAMGDAVAAEAVFRSLRKNGAPMDFAI